MKTHWKKLVNNDYINEGDLDNGNIVATIKSIGLKKVTNPAGKSEDMNVIEFAGDVKPMILSAKQNFKNLALALKSNYIEDWVGKQIEIYYDPSIKFGRDTVGGVRIKPIAPKVTKPILDQNNPKWLVAISQLKKGETSIDVIQKHYGLSSSDLLILKSIKQDA